MVSMHLSYCNFGHREFDITNTHVKVEIKEEENFKDFYRYNGDSNPFTIA